MKRTVFLLLAALVSSSLALLAYKANTDRTAGQPSVQGSRPAPDLSTFRLR